ncbi:MAG: hypothetical protein ACOCU8_03535 [Patescibacteria group bacterium]
MFEIATTKKIHNPLNWEVVAIGLLLILVVIYGYINSREFIKGPTVEITRMETKGNHLLAITGQVHNIARIQMNNRPIYTNDDGVFKENLVLLPGYNVLKLTAQDIFDRQTKIDYSFYQSPDLLAGVND